MAVRSFQTSLNSGVQFLAEAEAEAVSKFVTLTHVPP